MPDLSCSRLSSRSNSSISQTILESTRRVVRGIRVGEELSRTLNLHLFNPQQKSESAIRFKFTGDQINSKGLITKVLEGGVSNPKSLANTLPNSQWKAFAAAFNFVDSGTTPPSSTSSVATTTSDYVEQQLESDQGDRDVGAQLALYFQRVAPTVTSEIGILADPNLLQVAATIMGLPPAAAADLQPKTLSELMPLSDLKDPAKLTQLTERFTAMYDYTYGPSSGATSDLSVDSGNSSSEPSGAASVLASVISSNGSVLGNALNDFTGSTQPTFSTALMSSMSRLTLGG